MGTTKYSEQNHKFKEKELKLKEYSRLKGHESFSEQEIPRQVITFVPALRPSSGWPGDLPSSYLSLVMGPVSLNDRPGRRGALAE